MIFSGVTSAVSRNFSILTDIPSQPFALLGFNDLITFSIFSSVIGKSFIREEGAGKLVGISLSVSIVVHWSMKMSLNNCAFSVQSVINNPFLRGAV